MAVKIKINNKALAMDPSTKLRFEINSPIFDTDAIPGSYICPFDLPVLGNDIFENAEFIEINRIYKKYDCMVYLDDYPIYSGQLILNISNPQKYRCSVVLTGIDIDFPDRKLNTLNYQEDINMGGNPHDSTLVTGYAKLFNAMSESPIKFPKINCPNFYGQSEDSVSNWTDSPANADWGNAITNGGSRVGKRINNWNANSQQFDINCIRAQPNDTSVDNAFVLVPQFKLRWIIVWVFQNLGYNCIGDFFTDAFINKLLFLNYFALDDKVKRYFVSTDGDWQQNVSTTGRMEFGYGTADEQDNDNCFDFNLSEYTIKTNGYINIDCLFQAALCGQSGSPAFYITVHLTDSTSDVVIYSSDSTISNSWGSYAIHESYRAWSTDVGKRIYIQVVCYTGAFWIHNAKLVILAASYQNLNQYANRLHVANHMTSNTVGTVLNAIKKNFGLAMWFNADSQEVEISFLKDIFKSYRYIDISEFVIKNSLQITVQESLGYWITQKSDSNVKDITLLKNIGSFLKFVNLPIPDKLNVIAEVLQEGCYYIYQKNATSFVCSWVKYGTSVREIKKGITNDLASTNNVVTVDIGITTNIIIDNVLVPDSVQQGTSSAFDTGVNDTDMQLLIWHGMVNDLNGHPYPFATALKYDAAGNVIEDIELRLDGVNGIYPNFLQTWYDFMNTAEPVTLQMQLKSIEVISLLQLFKPQSNKASQQLRKIKYNGSLLLPKTFSFIVSLQGEYIEAQIDSLKEGGVKI